MNDNTMIWARRIFAVTAVIHVLLLTGGFFVLAPAFGFPDILRAPATERLAAYSAHQGAIVAAYYAMALSGLTQMALAVLGFRALRNSASTLALSALVAGLFGGAWQAMGFIRWAITVPYLADAMAGAQGATIETVTLLEGLLNRYAGMAVGEHLGFLGQGRWTALFSAAAMSLPALPRTIGVSGVLFGVAFLIASLEQLGGPFVSFGQITTPLTAAWFGWLLMAGICLARAGGGAPKSFGAVSWLGFILLLAGFIGLTVI